MVSTVVQMGTGEDPSGMEYSVTITKNGVNFTQGRFFTQVLTVNAFKPSITCTGLVSLGIGDTMDVRVFQNSGGNRSLNTGGTYLSIQQLPYQV